MLILAFATAASAAGSGDHGDMPKPATTFDRERALEISQAAIGNRLDGDLSFTDERGNTVRLADYRGKPLVISMIFTSCYHICPTTTQRLDKVVSEARDVLGDDAFEVLTVGFDTLRDTPPMMAQFRRQQDVDYPRWRFVATDRETVAALAADLGFQFVKAGSGFDHLIQTSVVGPTGRVERQVYGMTFDAPAVIEPIKHHVFGIDASDGFFSSVSKQVRLFCTVYDPASGKYRFDYSLYIGIVISILCVGAVGAFLVGEWRKSIKAGL